MRAGTGFGLLALAACAPVYSAGVPAPEHGTTASGLPPVAAIPRERPAADAQLAALLGRLVWPLATDRASALSSDYGPRARPGSGERDFHAGLDLRAPEGTPVYAAGDGTVVRSETLGAYGRMVLIDHGAELQSLYAHHARNLVAPGDPVRRGEVIALVGHSGNATGDHLHFELRWRGGTVDPWSVLPALRPAAGR